MPTVSYTLDGELAERVKQTARRAGLSASAYVSGVLRRAVLRDAALQYAAWLDSDDEARAEVDSFRRLGAPARYAGLDSHPGTAR